MAAEFDLPPRVSIVIPVYNVAPPLLERSLRSAFRQTFRPHQFEIVIVNDCSNDASTLESLHRLADPVCNARIVDHMVNQGLNAARHTGALAARGDFVLFLDGDDMLSRDAAERLWRQAVLTGAQLVTSGAIRWNEHTKSQLDLVNFGRPLKSDKTARLVEALSARRSFTMWGKLFDRVLLTDDVFDLPQGFLHEDIVTFSRLLFKADRVSNITDRTVSYVVNEGSITHNFREQHVKCMFHAIREMLVLEQSNGYGRRLRMAIAEGAERLVNVLVERTLFSPHLLTEKARLLELVLAEHRALALPPRVPEFQGAKFLKRFAHANDDEKHALLDQWQAYVTYNPGAHPTVEVTFPDTIRPTPMALRLTGKVVFLAQVDYHVRNALAFAETLVERGISVAVLDNSGFVEEGARRFEPRVENIPENVDYIAVRSGPYPIDWLSTPDLVITFHDWNRDFRDALEYRHRLDMPSACVVEGINDFLRVDFSNPAPLSYRNCDHVFLAGLDDAAYFDDRPTAVVGLPVIEQLATKTPEFPATPTAAINVNFTYGAMEEYRDAFVAQAVAGARIAGFDVVFTQHPADRGRLPAEKRSTKTQYEVIDSTSVFVSRFATGILEALASGKPTIYFNPHGEQAAKFKEPLGAFRIASDARELAAALRETLREIEEGVDFRERASAFLERHTGFGLPHSAAYRLANEVERIVSASSDTIESVRNLAWRRSHPFYPPGKLDATTVTRLAPVKGNKRRVLFLVISNNRYRERYAYLQEEYRRSICSPDDYLFVVGGAAKSWYDPASKVMHIAAGDSYEDLPEKVLKAIAFAHENFHFDTLIKVDDDVAINFPVLNEILDGTSAHYFGKMAPGTRGASPSTTWHFGKVSEHSRFHDTPYDFSSGPENWACGGMYGMSRYAASLIAREAATFDFAAHLYEDHMIGTLLTTKHGIQPLFIEEVNLPPGKQFIIPFIKDYLGPDDRLLPERVEASARSVASLHCGSYPPHYVFTRAEMVRVLDQAVASFRRAQHSVTPAKSAAAVPPNLSVSLKD